MPDTCPIEYASAMFDALVQAYGSRGDAAMSHRDEYLRTMRQSTPEAVDRAVEILRGQDSDFFPSPARLRAALNRTEHPEAPDPAVALLEVLEAQADDTPEYTHECIAEAAGVAFKGRSLDRRLFMEVYGRFRDLYVSDPEAWAKRRDKAKAKRQARREAKYHRAEVDTTTEDTDKAWKMASNVPEGWDGGGDRLVAAAAESARRPDGTLDEAIFRRYYAVYKGWPCWNTEPMKLQEELLPRAPSPPPPPLVRQDSAKVVAAMRRFFAQHAAKEQREMAASPEREEDCPF